MIRFGLGLLIVVECRLWFEALFNSFVSFLSRFVALYCLVSRADSSKLVVLSCVGFCSYPFWPIATFLAGKLCWYVRTGGAYFRLVDDFFIEPVFVGTSGIGPLIEYLFIWSTYTLLVSMIPLFVISTFGILAVMSPCLFRIYTSLWLFVKSIFLPLPSIVWIAMSLLQLSITLLNEFSMWSIVLLCVWLLLLLFSSHCLLFFNAYFRWIGFSFIPTPKFDVFISLTLNLSEFSLLSWNVSTENKFYLNSLGVMSVWDFWACDFDAYFS